MFLTFFGGDWDMNFSFKSQKIFFTPSCGAAETKAQNDQNLKFTLGISGEDLFLYIKNKLINE